MDTQKNFSIYKPISGWKIQLIILYYLSYLFGILVFALWILGETGQTFEESLGAALLTNAILFPFALVILIFGPIGIIQREMVKEISSIEDDESFSIEIKYNGKVFCFGKDEISFSFNRNKYYTVLIFYRRFINSRGRLIDDEYCSIVGLRYGVGWNDAIIRRLYSFLLSKNIVQIPISSSENFFERTMKL